MRRISRILVATDFSGAANAAVKRAARLAHDLNAELHLAYIIEERLLDQLRELMPSGDSGTEPPAVGAARTRLGELAGLLANHYAIRAEVHLSVGVPYGAIIEWAGAVAADLLVVGAHGMHSYREYLLGSTTSRVIRLAAGPVLVVRSQDNEDYRQALVAIDFSSRSAIAIELALALAPHAYIEALHVVETPPAEALQAWGLSDEAVQDLRQREVRAAQRVLSTLLAGIEAAQAMHPAVEHGPPARVVVERAVRMRHNLVVIGRRGESTEEQMLLGGVAKHVVDDALCDVLVTG